jgi:hypothetical protein
LAQNFILSKTGLKKTERTLTFWLWQKTKKEEKK